MRPLLILYILLLPFLAMAQPQRVGVGAYAQDMPGMYTIFKGHLYFVAQDGTSHSLWQADTNGIITHVANLSYTTGGTNNAGRLQMAVLNDTLYFCAADSITGAELYGYDGVNAPFLVADINTGTQSSFPSGIMVLNGLLYFSAYTPAYGTELWVYKPDKHAASLLWDLEPGASSGDPHDMVALKGHLCFIAQTNASGKEVNFYDPVNESLNCFEIVSGKEGCNPMNVTLLNGNMYFSAKDPVYGNELFIFTGKTVPQRLTDVALANGDGFTMQASGIGMLDKYLYFGGSTGQTGQQLCRYDTATRQILIDTLNITGAEIKGFTAYHNKIYFFAKDPAGDTWLYNSNGIGNPVKIAQLQGIQYNDKVQMMVYGDWLYFTVLENNGSAVIYRYNDAITTGITSIGFDAVVNVYPNPANEKAYITVNKTSAENLRVALTDAMGRQVYTGVMDSKGGTATHVLSIAQLTTGVYFVSLYDDNGKLQYSSKLQKQ